MMLRRSTVVCVAGLLAAGIVAASQIRLAKIRAGQAAAFAERTRDLDRLRRENEGLREARQQALSAAEDGPASARNVRMAGLRGIAELLGRSNGGVQGNRMSAMISSPELRDKIPAYVIDGVGRLPVGFGELFALEGNTVAKLQEALTSARDRAARLILANSAIRDAGDGTVFASTKSLPQGLASALGDELLWSFRQALGEDGYRAFVLLNSQIPSLPSPNGDRQLLGGDFFQSFGLQDRSITITRETVSPTQMRYRYRIETARRDPFGLEYGSSGVVPDRGKLGEVLGPVMEILPAGF